MNHFDPKLNLDNLQQCLVKVVRMDHSSISSTEEMAEFESYYILTNLGIYVCVYLCACNC